LRSALSSLFALRVDAQRLAVSELLKIFLRLRCGLFLPVLSVVGCIT
jgi:hypothetical protein